MYDYDSEFVWDYEMSSHDYLDEMYHMHTQRDTYTSDDDYARDSTDYQALAYIHYA